MIVLAIQGTTVLAAGDSREYGLGLSDRDQRWAKRVALAGGAQLVDDGNPGMTLEQLGSKYYVATNMATWQAGVHSYVFLCFLTNDVRQDPALFTVAGFKTQLLADLDTFHQQRGIPYQRMVLSSEWFTAYLNGSYARLLAYNQAVRECAQARNCIFIDQFAAFATHPDPLSLFQDEANENGRLHENEAGHAFKAQVYLNGDYTPENDKAASNDSWHTTRRWAA
ncbi:MAG: SGNH/GDSL hydrolase family protein [Janthinobacterium lividum]